MFEVIFAILLEALTWLGVEFLCRLILVPIGGAIKFCCVAPFRMLLGRKAIPFKRYIEEQKALNGIIAIGAIALLIVAFH